MTRYFYAYSHAGRGPVDLYRFTDRRERERWVNGGWGRLPWTKRSAPAELVWVDAEVYHADGTKVACESASLTQGERQ